MQKGHKTLPKQLVLLLSLLIIFPPPPQPIQPRTNKPKPICFSVS